DDSPTDAGMWDDAGPTNDGGLPGDGEDDGPVAVLYSDANSEGYALELGLGYHLNLAFAGEGHLMETASSVEVPEGMVVYGFSGVGYIGTVTNAIVGPATVNLTGADNDAWESVII